MLLICSFFMLLSIVLKRKLQLHTGKKHKILPSIAAIEKQLPYLDVTIKYKWKCTSIKQNDIYLYVSVFAKPSHRDILWGQLGGGFLTSEFVSLHLIEIVILWGTIPPIPMCSLSRKNIFSTIFHNNLNMCFVHTFSMELEFTIHYLSPNAFSYIVSTHILHAKYEDPCLITWWKFLLSKDCAILI